MTLILNIVIPIVAALFIVLALRAVLRALQIRSETGRQPYDVGRQETRRKMQIGFLRAGIFLVAGLIVLALYGLGLPPAGELEEEAAPLPSATLPILRPTSSATPSPTSEATPAVDTPEPSPTNQSLGPTETPSPTATPQPSAVVNSEVGLYLREAPGGTQELELLPNGTVLILLPGRETVDGTEWQQVRAPSGLEGWVAVDFIIYR